VQAHVALQQEEACLAIKVFVSAFTSTLLRSSCGWHFVCEYQFPFMYLTMPDHMERTVDRVHGCPQLEHLDMTDVQAELYADALNSLRSAARSSGLQPGAPVAAKQCSACALRAFSQACSAHA
jgi:hypothetical protein